MIFLLVIASLFFLARRLMQRGSPARLVTFGFLSVLGVHFALRWLPHTTYAEALMLTAVCLASLVALGGMIYHDYQQEGSITRGQEEMLLIAVAALVWLTLSMAWRLTGDDFIESGAAGSVATPQSSRAVDRPYGTSRRLADTGCVPGMGRVCVVEEWYW